MSHQTINSDTGYVYIRDKRLRGPEKAKLNTQYFDIYGDTVFFNVEWHPLDPDYPL